MEINKKPKLLVLTQTHNLWGGIESWMANVLPCFERSGWDVEYGLALGEVYNEPDSFLAQHSYIRKSHYLDGRVGTPFSRQHSIEKVVIDLNPDVIMPLGIGDVFPVVRRLRNNNVWCGKLLIAIHSTHSGTLADLVENSDLVDMVGVISGLLYRWACLNISNFERRVRLIRNGVPRPIFSKKKFDNNQICIGFVGRLENDIKRAEDIVPIVREILKGEGNPKLLIAGDGPSSYFLRSSLGSISGWNDYNFFGFISRERIYKEVYPLLDCLLLSSETEGSPLAIIEAMHHGVVPVVSEFRGLASEGLLIPEYNCLTFPIGRVDIAARKFEMLQKFPEFYEKLSSNAKRSVVEYSIESMLDGWMDALNSVYFSKSSSVVKGELSQHHSYGRLEKIGFSPKFSNFVRRLFFRGFKHMSGFDEWPGSVSSDSSMAHHIERELEDIEGDALMKLSIFHGYTP